MACMEYVTGDVDYVSRTLEVRHGVQPITTFFFFSSPPDSLTRAQTCTALQCGQAGCCFLYFEAFFFFSQTEDPAMERPYTFKDFLLRPRRSVLLLLVLLYPKI